MLEVIKEPISGLLIIKPKVFKDYRGFFTETWNLDKYKDIGLVEEFVQDNWSRSTQNVLRGLHYQKKYPQGKLVSVRTGSVFDVAVDIRKESSTFGHWYGEVLSDENHLQMYVPPGFAHGFYVLSETADFTYRCTEYYKPEDETGIKYDDPNIGIKWPSSEPVVSSKDSKLPYLK